MATWSWNPYVKIVIFLTIPAISVAYPTWFQNKYHKADITCGYQSCPEVDPSKLNVHLVPHSHDDVGWLKTVDQYYYGANTNYQRAGVQYILESVIDALEMNPERRFIYVETAFFWKWWMEQDEARQQQVKDLVNQGRLEFIGGAWSMNDEACSHYQSIIDQFTWGLRKLNDTFGSCGRPHVGWQIDPFGHSREMASIFSRMGYDGLFFARLDYQDKSQRLASNQMEIVWEGSANLGSVADLFTSVLYNHYSAPASFCFDVLCNDDPFIDNEKSPDYNVPEMVLTFANFAQYQASKYTSKNILITMGDDFNYQDALMNFKNMDKLIKYVNAAHPELNVIYSTPSCYLKAVNDEGLTYQRKQDDFFPYASDAHSYWTGYYTSRPTSKYLEKLGNNFLQVGKQLVAMTQLGQVGASALDSLREAVGMMQHHDAITGTEKQHVADDYARIISASMEEVRVSVQQAINSLISDTAANVQVFNCLQLNVSKCEVTETQDQFVVTVYNPMSHAVTHFVRLPVPSGTFTVQDPSGAEQTIQFLPVPEQVRQAPERENSGSSIELVFRAEDIPPLGFRSYYVTKINSSFEEVPTSDDLFIGDSLQVLLDENSGLVKSVINNDVEVTVKQNLYYYEGFNGDNQSQTRSSGAYVFRPVDSNPTEITDTVHTVVYKGPLVDEIHQNFSSWASQVIRIYKNENHVEFDWIVGPIPVGDVGTEVVSRYTTDFDTKGIFYTDSNGRELLERKRDFRPTWTVNIQEPASGNYYPVTSRILIRDENKALELAVLNDRPQGGSSLNDGEVELMVHRRLVHDDGFGVGEALNETPYGIGLFARGKHYLMAGDIKESSPNMAAQERELAQRKSLSPWLFFMNGESGFEDWQSKFKMEYSGITESLPINAQILTLEPWKDKTLLLRLEHIMENNEDTELSKPVEIAYGDLFSTFSVTSTHESTLAANQWLEDMNRLNWKSETNTMHDHKQSSTRANTTVTLEPMEIATYIVTVSKR